MLQQEPRTSRKRVGLIFFSGVATGVLATLVLIVLSARLLGPPRTAYTASAVNVPAPAPAVNAPVGNAPPPVNGPVNEPAANTPVSNAPAVNQPFNPTPAPAVPEPSIRPETDGSASGRLLLPVQGIDPSTVHDNFTQMRGAVRHEALDIMAPRGTPVVAADDGVIRKLFVSRKGGNTIYQYSPDETLCYYYAHLDRYAEGVEEGQTVRRGQLIGYVGTSGNADPGGPHLHFAVTQLGPNKKWWQGPPIDPYPLIFGQ